MAPLSSAEQIQRRLGALREKVRGLFAHGAWRWVWRFFTALSIVGVLVGAAYAYSRFPAEGLQVRPAFFGLALGIYILTFAMQLAGWHRLSRLLFGGMSLRQDVEAVAASNLVKYLPTIAWYIANRAHYYGQHGVAQASVVAASLYELGFMVGACALLLLLVWLAEISLWLAGLALLALALAGLALALIRRRRNGGGGPLAPWALAALCYAATWPLAGLFLWAVLAAFTPVGLGQLPAILHIWLLSSLASYAVSLTLGMFGIAREITLTALLTQLCPLPVAIAAAIVVKLLLTLGELICSLILLGLLRITRARPAHE